MKKAFFIILSVVFCSGMCARAQQADTVGFDENDKYIYYQVVDMPGVAADTLLARAVYFMKEAYPAAQLKFKKQNEKTGEVKGEGGLMVSQKGLLTQHEDGKIAYDLVIEVKDGKYRYWFTDFVLIPYERDRYANFVPVNGKKVVLEHSLRLLGQKDLDDYLQKITDNSRLMGKKLKAYMSNGAIPVIKKSKTKPTVIKKDW